MTAPTRPAQAGAPQAGAAPVAQAHVTSSSATPEEKPGFEVWAAFFETALTGQEARKSSIEQRGIAVITTSGTLVTLLFAVIGLATKEGQTFTLPNDTRRWLIAAVVLLVLAALCGLASNIPLAYAGLTAAGMRGVIDTMWRESAWAASGRVARTRVDLFDRAQQVNKKKAWILFAGVVLEAGALIPLAVAVVQITN